ncbi:MAG: biotin/lipoyl-containing protein [Eubacteriales bacterium]
MKFEQVLELVRTVSDSKIITMKYEEGDTKILLEMGQADMQIPQSKKIDVVLEDNKVITCPLVGTFYTAPGEDAEDFVKAGDQVTKGQTLAIVEAMKLMNEIESDISGEIVEVLVKNGEKVEYGQPLFTVRP